MSSHNLNIFRLSGSIVENTFFPRSRIHSELMQSGPYKLVKNPSFPQNFQSRALDSYVFFSRLLLVIKRFLKIAILLIQNGI